MYAIIRTGGHQEKVAPGDTILIDRIKTEPGEKITLQALLVSDDETTVTDRADLEQRAVVTGEVIEHVKGAKVDVFQYRQKTGYRRHIGHRQALTAVKILGIRLGDHTVTAEEAEGAQAEKEQADRAASEEARDAARKAREERAEAKKAAAKKKAPLKKTAAKKKAPLKKAAAKEKASEKKG